MDDIPYWRLGSLYFFYFSTVGIVLPYLGPYLSYLGYDAAAIGILASIPMATKMVAPNLWGWFADRSGRLLLTIQLGALLSALTSVAVFANQSFVYLAGALFLFSFFWNAIIPQFEVITLSYLGKNASRYSQIRVWGSIGFICAVVLLGWYFDRFSMERLPAILFVLLMLVYFATLCMPRVASISSEHDTLSVKKVFADPTILAFFLAVFLLQISHGAYYGFYSLFMEDHGYSKTHIGMLWAIGVIAEIVLFYKCPSILQRFSLRACFLFSLAVAAIRWLLIGGFPGYWGIIIGAQLLHALTFGLVHAVSIEIIRRHFGHKFQGQGQALYSAFSLGAGTALGAFSAGLIWEKSPFAIFVFASLASVLAWLIAYTGLKKLSVDKEHQVKY